MRRTLSVSAVPVLVLLVLLAAAFFAPALAEQAPEAVRLNQRLSVNLADSERRFTFLAPSNNVYAFQSFGGEGAQAELFSGSQPEPIASGDGFHFSARLVADRQYTLVVRGQSGIAHIEIMRDALGRCFDRPLEIRDLNTGYNKVITRAYDVHWYRFVPDESGLYMIVTRSNLDTVGVLLDARGNEVIDPKDAGAPRVGNFCLQARLVKGTPYYLRVCGAEDAKGRYQLRFIRAAKDAPVPSEVTLSVSELSLKDGERVRITAAVSPRGALEEIVWISSNPRVAKVTESGVVTAVSSGTADITALAFGGVSARCAVNVRPIPVESVEFTARELSLPVGERQPLGVRVLPEKASNRRVRFESADPGIALVDEDGNLTAHKVGETKIRAVSMDGGLTAELSLTVTPTPPKYRALVMGEQRYVDGRIRVGSVNTTRGMADLLRAQDFGGYGYEVTMRMDSSRDEAVAAIRDAFADAQAGDVSLFYINCHGRMENGAPYLEFFDGSKLSARGLEAELRNVPGTVVVIIDCCNSGGFIEKGQASQFGSRVIGAFGADQSGAFAVSKYRVLCSSSAAQDSLRIAFDGKKTESSMITVLANSLCEAGGWNPFKSRTVSMKADRNKDHKVTLEEVYQYAYRRVKQCLQLADVGQDQDVQVYPRGSQFVLFSR